MGMGIGMEIRDFCFLGIVDGSWVDDDDDVGRILRAKHTNQ